MRRTLRIYIIRLEPTSSVLRGSPSNALQPARVLPVAPLCACQTYCSRRARGLHVGASPAEEGCVRLSRAVRALIVVAHGRTRHEW